MRITLFSLFFALMLVPSLRAQEISGRDSSYAGQSLRFYYYSNYFTLTEVTAGKTTVSADGTFTVSLKIPETTVVYSDAGKYRLYLYVEPGKTYNVILPGRTDKTEADLLNPYFEPQEVHLMVRGIQSSDLNFLVKSFEDAYMPYFNTFALNVYAKSKPMQLETALLELSKTFPATDNHFFEDYKRYRIGLLTHLAYKYKARAIANQYFRDQPVLYLNPAYNELFARVYDRYLLYISRPAKGSDVFDYINKKQSLSLTDHLLKQDSLLTDHSLREIVLLKSLYDEFYQSSFSRNGILTLLDSIEKTSPIAQHKQIAADIMGKVSRLMPGYPPPAVTLLNANGDTVRLLQFKEKYVYLIFCSCVSYSCLQEFRVLDDLQKKFAEHLQIVVVSTDTYANFKAYNQQNNPGWMVLHYANQPAIMKEYDIRAYPTSFLIDPQGKLLSSPAPAPSENFELRFNELLHKTGKLRSEPEIQYTPATRPR